MRTIRLTLPYPPSVNTYWRSFRGRYYVSKEGVAFKKNVAMLAGQQKPFAGPVSVVIEAFRPRKIGDLDNIMKALLDSLKGIAFNDDKQVVHIIATRFDDKERPRTEVCVSEWELFNE